MAVSGTHREHEAYPWTVNVGNHPQRTESPGYRRSRALMTDLVKTAQPWVLGDPPYQDHHGGGVWVRDADGWFLTWSPYGIEWSAQFCADPGKVDRCRIFCVRLLAAFPSTIAGYEQLGYPDAAALLATPITDAPTVAAWTDGIFNAAVPLPAAMHTGTLPAGAGYHHYPKPIVDILLFKYDDFELFVPDGAGRIIAVTPVSPRGSGDGRVAIAWQPDVAGPPTSRGGAIDAQSLALYASAPDANGEAVDVQAVDEEPPDRDEKLLVLPADSVAAQHAFAHQH